MAKQLISDYGSRPTLISARPHQDSAWRDLGTFILGLAGYGAGQVLGIVLASSVFEVLRMLGSGSDLAAAVSWSLGVPLGFVIGASAALYPWECNDRAKRWPFWARQVLVILALLTLIAVFVLPVVLLKYLRTG